MSVILIVDDDVLLTLGACGIFEDLGYECITAYDGKEALAIIEQRSGEIAGIFSDIVMPEMSGLELASVVRDKYPDIPILLTTGFAPQAKSFLSGFTILPKPYDDDSVEKAFKLVCDKNKAPNHSG